MTAKREFKISEFMNRAETDDKVFTFYGAKQLVTNDIFVLRATKALSNVSDGEHMLDGVKIEVQTKK